ncbi:anti-sigma-K factor RskA [Silvimonas terrae]|uniref:Anti-sigma-K factor RskA n=1 Tax=Silvimonas terrae TaxID=300266 RepID=A0A840RJ86_9NEIS|nr:anti-sigma factor [Silvimonas terrae]MBB5193375.1 anti-sigma-K factor RskA [Silvimonas terrae]
MNYRNPELQQQLANEYVIGTLRGPARRRFEAIMFFDAALRRTVRETEAQLLPIIYALPEVTPPASVWRGVSRRVRALRPAPPMWSWESVYFWRLLAGGLGLACLVLAMTLTLPGQPAPTTAHMALLADPQSHVAALMARVAPDGHVRIATLQDLGERVGANKSLELWAIPEGGKPRSLGVIAANGPTDVNRPEAMQSAAVLAVSLEPQGGSPTGAPTGPVLWVGKLVDL